jgi:excisionase family DNA binding protein
MHKLTYSVKEAAELTGLHPVTIHRHLTAHKLRSKLVGRLRLIDAHSLHEFIGVADASAA